MRASRAFTMIELIFVIVILGILSAIALPKFTSTGTQARIAAGKADVAAIRSAILAERQKGIIKGQSAYIENGTGTDGDGNKQLNNGGLFGGVLTYPKKNSNSDGNWYTANTANGNFSYIIDGTSVSFDYNATTGTFTCDPTSGTADQKKYCKELIY
jgi:general secretion pathway protein G